MGRDERQVIEVRLERPHDMFEMPQTDLFSEYRNFLTGVELCLSELRGRSDRRPVRLEIELPASEIDGELHERMSRHAAPVLQPPHDLQRTGAARHPVHGRQLAAHRAADRRRRASPHLHLGPADR